LLASLGCAGQMRLYRILIRFLKVVNELYFVDIRATGRDKVPATGPVILAANHPSSILDSIVLATQLKRPINYLARSGLFRFGPLAALFRRLGAVPIYRARETADADQRNLIVFEKVFELLERGGCVGIFPEGRNSPPTRIGPLRKGAARLALGAEARNNNRLGLVVVPVGVNFENRGFLMSAVLLRFGAPIRVADYAELYRDEPESALSKLTDDIKQALSQQVLTIEDARLGQLVDELAAVFGDKPDWHFEDAAGGPDEDEKPQRFLKRWLWQMAAWYRRTTPESARAFERRMHSRQHIRDVLVAAWQAQPRRVVALRNRLERYKDHLRQTELREALGHAFDGPVRERLIRLKMTLYSVLVAPIALFGLIHNLVPYLVARGLGRLGRDEAVRAFTLFGIGVLAFGASYTAIGLWLWQTTNFSLVQTLAYVAVLPPTGFAALRYRRNVLIYRDRILVRTIFFNRGELVDLLRRERQLLYEEFSDLDDLYGPE
jgi:glycerol-3-phosphate O-acyltransferase / dihydroxyacetone phosphate acyltransferase